MYASHSSIQIWTKKNCALGSLRYINVGDTVGQGESETESCIIASELLVMEINCVQSSSLKAGVVSSSKEYREGLLGEEE